MISKIMTPDLAKAIWLYLQLVFLGACIGLAMHLAGHLVWSLLHLTWHPLNWDVLLSFVAAPSIFLAIIGAMHWKMVYEMANDDEEDHVK